MLGKIFGSNTRVKILKLFLLHPESKFYIRQIARGLKLQINSVRRELENLEKFGVLVSSSSSSSSSGKVNDEETKINNKLLNRKTFARSADTKQEKKYYKANTGFVLYEELKALIVKSQILYEKNFVQKIQSAGKPKLLILSGIFVNNDNAAVDLLIVGRFKKAKLLRIIKELENELGKEINYTILAAGEYKYRRDITDVFLYDILEGKKIVVIDEVGLS
ncbi:MAG: hypothetical protein U9R06_01180 [Patescibacteria group bacterium]|nr:hypothetical protein [Patescibacteria group bacterium]